MPSPRFGTDQLAVKVKTPSRVRAVSELDDVRSAGSGYVAVAPPGNLTAPFCST